VWGFCECGNDLHICERRIIHSNSVRHGVLFCETWRSHTGVDEDYAVSTGEGWRTFRWNAVPSFWVVGPEDEGKLTNRQGETSQMTWIFTDTAVRISPSPIVVPKRRQETTILQTYDNGANFFSPLGQYSVKSQKRKVLASVEF